MSRLPPTHFAKLAIMVLFGACGDGGTSPTGNGGTTTPVVSSVVINVSEVTLTSLGDTVTLTAQASDASGNTVSGKTFTWASSNAEVATVSSTGLVTAVSNGSVTITATTNGVSGMATVVVGVDSVIRVAAFNIQVFGKTKAGKDSVMSILARIVREFDLVVVQEIRDISETVADDFLTRINADSGVDYAMYEGPRLGRTTSKEQYVAYYRTSRIERLDAYIQPDPDDVFEREPLVATFRAGNFDFTLVAAHIKPDSADTELAALAGVAHALLVEHPDEGDVILLGDFNADCRFFDEDDDSHPLRAQDFHWVIDNEWDTTTTATDCTYDRIVLVSNTFSSEYVAGSAAPFYFDERYGLTEAEFVQSVSDHYPVVAEFFIAERDDDPQGSGG